jgi:hypothetical protein
MSKIATELEWLKYFYGVADFGPADGDVREIIKDNFRNKTGKKLPKGYDEEE